MTKFIPLLFLIAIIATGCATPFGAILPELSLVEKYNKDNEIKAKYQLINTALKMTAKADPKDTIKVTVGSDEVLLGGTGEFEPSVKISRWGEVSLKLTPKGLETIASKDKKLSFDKNKIKYETPKIDYVMYDLPVSEELAEGGFEYEIILKEKPSSNVVEYDLETQGLEFFYQPFLANKNDDGSTWEEVDGDRVERPANINGSYAVYYENGKSGDFSATVGKKNYKAGKMGHIYRPKIIDAKGNWIWGKFNTDLQNTKKLTVEIDKEWLDKAVYPVVVDPTMGYTTVGGTVGSYAENTLRGWGAYTPADNGIIQEIYQYIGADGSTASARGAVYASSTPYARITWGYQISLTTTDQWNYYSVTSTAVTAGTYYLLGSWLGTEGTGFSPYYDATNGYAAQRDNTAYSATNDPPANFTIASTASPVRHSVYAVYSCTSGTCSNTYDLIGTHYWTVPTGVTSANVACWGGGASTPTINGGGGGGGAYAASTVAVTAGNSYEIVVGAGGINGNNGATSTFATTIVIADGGKTSNNNDGGIGGTTVNSVGDTEFAGGNGGLGNGTDGGGGGGGAGPDGAGINGSDNTTTGGNGGAGDNGSGGAGGSGGINQGSNGTANVLGGGGGGGAGNQTFAGGKGANYGGGAGGGDVISFNNQSGGNGACTITYTISTGGTPSTSRPAQIIIFD